VSPADTTSRALARLSSTLTETSAFVKCGRITRVSGLTIEARLPAAFIGELCIVKDLEGRGEVMAEVVGFRDGTTILMPMDYIEHVGMGSPVVATGKAFTLKVGDEFLGRVLDGLCEPLDGGPIPNLSCPREYPVFREAPQAMDRPRITQAIPSGIKCIDTMLTWGKGQRMGVFSGSGVGKSTLFGMIARNSGAQVNVLALIGERGREVKEFLERDLGEEGLAKSVVVVVTSNEAPVRRVKGALVAMTIAEYFRDQGKDVLFLMDSLTRYTYALREIGLALGEPPTTRGYTPSVYAKIPQLAERAGITSKGSITALFTVLVEGDDVNEPVADIARSVLDGHIVLSRKLLTEGQLPPVDVKGSISRVFPDVTGEEQQQMAQWVRETLAIYEEAEDLINIGAYKRGNNPRIDAALDCIDMIKAFMVQRREERWEMHQSLASLKQIYDAARGRKGK
jgi:flagellum-specific ATP synthase